MRIESAVLCDAASVREGLLHILGGGVTGTSASAFPAPLNVTFAFRAVLESREAGNRHTLAVIVKDAVSEREIATSSVFFARIEDGEPTPEEALVFPLSLDDIKVPHSGKYLVEASLDNNTFVTIPFRVDSERTDESRLP